MKETERMSIDDLPAYKAVYVVSDLHLGGYSANYGDQLRDYRIFRESKALAGFVNLLAAPEEEVRDRKGYQWQAGPIALVLNGDIVDFLADEKATYFDWLNAVDKLKSAMADAEQKVVWEALKAFVSSGRGDLVLVLGNHDLELALPEPQAHLQHYLSGGDPVLRGRVVFAMDGAGFSCRVGGKRVLCLHGNEADPWNAIDYGRLSLIRRALARGSIERNHKVLRQWIPNAGTQMVIEYMNLVKRQYQWVDLLKPEEEASAMVTSAIANMPGLRTFAEVQLRKASAARKLADGFLGGVVPATTSGNEAENPPQDELRAPLVREQLMRETLDSLSRDARPVDLVSDEDFLMGRVELVVTGAAAKVMPRWSNTLRDVLRYSLAQDQTFDPGTADDTFTELDQLCGREIDFLVAGHTHLYRALERMREPGRYYFNSGTWIRLARIPIAALSNALFPIVEQRLRDGSMKALEESIAGQPLLITRRTVVRIQENNGTVRGALSEVVGEEPLWDLEDVPDTTLPRPKQ